MLRTISLSVIYFCTSERWEDFDSAEEATDEDDVQKSQIVVEKVSGEIPVLTVLLNVPQVLDKRILF